MSEYVDIGWCKDYDCYVAVHSYLCIGIQHDDITGTLTMPKHRWESLTKREQDYYQDAIKHFIAGWEARKTK
jgi:hypothetical protein